MAGSGQGAVGLDAAGVYRDLDAAGYALTGPVLGAHDCAVLAARVEDATGFRATVDMARHRFGEGQYRYFDHPLPPVVTSLRRVFYQVLLPVAQEWAARLRREAP